MATAAIDRQPFVRGLYAALAVVALTTLLEMSVFLRDGDKLANDFKVLWAAAGSATPYAPQGWPFAYPPTTLLWLKPLTLLPMWAAFVLWGAVSASAYGYAVKQEIGERWPIAFLLFPTGFGLMTGQLSLAVAAMVFTAFRTPWTGLILGLAFTIKPQLVFLAPLALLMLRDWRQLTWFALTVSALVTLSIAWLGSSLWADWLGSFEHFRQRAEALEVLAGAASPAGVAAWFGLNPLPFLLAGCLLAVAALRNIAASRHRGVMLGLCCILASPYALAYDLVIVLPLVVGDLLKPGWRTLPAFMIATAKGSVVGLVALAIDAAKRKEALDAAV